MSDSLHLESNFSKPEEKESKAAPSKLANEKEITVKVICLGDSAVGKSKLLERFLRDDFKPQQTSTFALTLYKYHYTDQSGVKQPVTVDFWDTAGQERFQSLHASYYHQADACIMVFDATRKVTYKNLPHWYCEMRQYRPEIPCFCAANKIDSNMDITTRSFAFPARNNIPMYFVSAASGSNVVKLFRDAIDAAVIYKRNPTHWTDKVLLELEKLPDPSAPIEQKPYDDDDDS